jgi:hypothetical protein
VHLLKSFQGNPTEKQYAVETNKIYFARTSHTGIHKQGLLGNEHFLSFLFKRFMHSPPQFVLVTRSLSPIRSRTEAVLSTACAALIMSRRMYCTLSIQPYGFFQYHYVDSEYARKNVAFRFNYFGLISPLLLCTKSFLHNFYCGSRIKGNRKCWKLHINNNFR